VQSKLRETRSLEDFGAVGDGIADDTVAIQTAFNNSFFIFGTHNKNYRITSTILINSFGGPNLNDGARTFDGRGCRFTKDFAGVGISVVGGASTTQLENFTINASATHSASDYSASNAEHGLLVTNNRCLINNVTSNNHKGAGFMLLQNAPNANSSKFFRLRASNNGFAGCAVDGNFPTADDFADVEFEGNFFGNFGYGFHSSSTSPMRQWTARIFTENNQRGASAPRNGGIRLERAIACTIWAYSEEVTGGQSPEIVLAENASSCIVTSARRNADTDAGSRNLWMTGSQRYRPDTSRQTTVDNVFNEYSRVNEDADFVETIYSGFGGDFGAVRGQGGVGGGTRMRLLSPDKTTSVDVRNTAVDVLISGSRQLRVESNKAQMPGVYTLQIQFTNIAASGNRVVRLKPDSTINGAVSFEASFAGWHTARGVNDSPRVGVKRFWGAFTPTGGNYKAGLELVNQGAMATNMTIAGIAEVNDFNLTITNPDSSFPLNAPFNALRLCIVSTFPLTLISVT